MTTSNFDAEFGRAGGSVTTVVLKSGTNQFKGSVFAFGNNESTQARNYFASATSKNPDTKYQQFGATLGGPIIKDKLFFFTDYQRTVDNLGQLRRVVIPPAEWRNGDFSSASTKIYDPATGNADGTGRTPFPGNIIPVGRLSPVALNILAQIPQPNIPGAAFGQVNYELPSSEREKTTDAFNVKLNYNPTSSDQMSLRFSYQRPEIFVPGTFGELGGAGADFAGTGYQNTYSTALTWTRTLSQSLIMEWRAGFSKYHNEAQSTGQGLESSTEVGIPGANYDDFSSGISRITIGNGFTDPLVGFSNSLPWDRGETTVSVVGMLTKLTGNHTIKVGTEVRHNEDFLLQIQDAGGVRGQFSFNGARTAIPTDSAAQNGIANAFASFLLDAPSQIQRDVKVIDRPGTKHWAVFAFVQDKWQATPKLTVDLGLRWEYYTPLVGIEDQGGLSNYDPSNNTVQVAGYGSIPQNIGVQSTWTNFAPRLGASYRFNEKTVLRAGFGTTIVPFPDNRYAYNFPVKQTNQFNAPNSFAPAGQMANGFGPPDFFPIPDSGIVDASIPQLRNSQLFYVQPDLKEAKLHSWNVAFQRQLPWNLVAEVAYVGNVGKGILLPDWNINAGMTLGADNAGRPYYQLYGRTANVLSWLATDTSYNSLQAKLDRRFRNGFLVTTSYTLGRAINYSEETGVATPADLERSKGRPNFDRTHVFASSFIWDMPFFEEGDGALHWILGGWQVSGIFTAYSGTPVNFTASAATLRAPGNTQRPNVNGEPEVFGDIGPGQKYFDTSVFSAPGGEHLGQHEAQRLDRRPRLLEPRRLAHQAPSVRPEGLGRAAGGRLQPDQHAALQQPERLLRPGDVRRDQQLVRPAARPLRRAGDLLGVRSRLERAALGRRLTTGAAAWPPPSSLRGPPAESSDEESAAPRSRDATQSSAGWRGWRRGTRDPVLVIGPTARRAGAALAGRLVFAPGKGLRARDDAGEIGILRRRRLALLLSLFRALGAALRLGHLLFLLVGLAETLVDRGSSVSCHGLILSVPGRLCKRGASEASPRPPGSSGSAAGGGAGGPPGRRARPGPRAGRSRAP